MAVTIGWKGAVDTDLHFTEFYPGNHSIVVWFLPQYPNSYAGPILAVNGAGSYMVGLGDRNTQESAHLISRVEGAGQVHIPASLPAGQWCQLAVVRTGNDVQVFLNGVPLGAKLTVTGSGVPVGTLRLGRPSPGAGVDSQEAQFYGMLDELAIYGRALTNAEVLGLFTTRAHLTGNEPDLLFGWLFTPTPQTKPSLRMRRVFFRSGETELVPNSSNWSSQDVNLIPLPALDAMELPFLTGEAWSIPQGFAADFSHRGYAAFCLDFVKADVGVGFGDVYPNGSFKAPILSVCPGAVITESHASPPVSSGDDESENMIVVRGADKFERAYLHLLKDSNRVSVGQTVKNGQPLTQISTEWRCPGAGPHLHFGVNAPPESMVGWVTVPAAFSNYEVRQSNGSWAFVSRGIPKISEVVRRAGSLSTWDQIGHANNVVAMTAINKKLYAVTSDNKLWRRDREPDVDWAPIGHANKVVGMAGANCKLYAATSDGKLWWRDPDKDNINWDEIGHANRVVSMASTNAKLFAVTSDNKLWWRDQVGTNAAWAHIGHANNVRALAATGGKLFAATKDDKLWWREPVGTNVPWHQIGHANNVVAMAGSNGRLYAATSDNKLWMRDA